MIERFDRDDIFCAQLNRFLRRFGLPPFGRAGQVIVDLRASLLGGLGDRHPQLPLGHRRDQVPVLDRAGQLRVFGTPGLKVGAPPQHHQGRPGLVRSVPGGGGRVQRGDERPPLALLGALGEQLLELVHH
jgi:hypothetical protein